MADTKITDLTLATAAVGDELVINDVTDTSDKKITVGGIIDIINGDINVNSSGTATFGSGVIVNADINASAAIAYSKLNLTNSIDSGDYVDGSIDNEHLANGAVDTEEIADNAVSLAKMAHGTDGNLITYDSSGAPAAVATGNSGQVLTSNGAGAAPTFQDATGGLDNVVEDTTPQLGGDLDAQGNNITSGGVIFLNEQAEADADVAGDGQIWVDTATPNVLMFTDDAGTDFRINFSTSAQLAAMVSDETGSGSLVFATSPTLVTPVLGTPTSGTLTNCTGLPIATGLASGTKANLESVLSDVSDIAEADGDVYTGTHDFGGADDLEIPNGTAPTVDTQGQIALDTDITNHTPLITFHDGTETQYVISIPTDQLTSTDGHVIAYNATDDEFEMVAGSSGTLSALSDTTITAAGKGDILVHNGTAWIDLSVGSNDQVLTADSGEASGVKWAAAAGGGGDLTQYPFPCTLEVPEGTVAYPDIHTLSDNASAKVSGFVLPDGASTSTINFKCVVPSNLASTPAMKIRVRIMTLGAVGGPADVRLTVSTVGIADTESLDTALTDETETTVTMPTATETMDYYTQDLTTDWAEADTIIGQIKRDPTDSADDFTDDIMIVGVDLLADYTPA